MKRLQEHLDDLAPVAALRLFATSLAACASVDSDRQAGYVSLRPPLEGAIAVYVLRDRISIALPPPRALQVAPHLPRAVLQKKTPATTYLVMDAAAVAAQQHLVLDVAAEAVEWRASGPKVQLGSSTSKKPAKEPMFCPEHWVELLPSGRCPFCE